MSVLDVGARCSSCDLVDFLPISCNHCSLIYCKNHIATHGCVEISIRESYPEAGPSSFARKTRCDVKGCTNPTIESIGGFQADSTEEETLVKRVRCLTCGGAFCTAHRAQKGHSCSGPLDYTKRDDAAQERKRKAQEVLAQHFPEAVGRSVPKPPPPKTIQKTRPASPARLPPSLQQHPSSSNSTPTEPGSQKRPKTKSEKLFDIHVRKIRSLAKPLDGKVKEGDKRFFECVPGVTDIAKVKNWEEVGKLDSKPERYWVLTETPVGKVMDTLIAINKVKRPIGSADPSQTLSLLALHAPPDQPRAVIRLENAQSAQSLPEGSLVILVQGWV